MTDRPEGGETTADVLDKLAEKIRHYNTVPHSVKETLDKLGLQLNPKETPHANPTLPKDISVLDIKQLNQLYDSFALYYDYISRELSKAETNLLTVKSLRKLLDAALHFRYKDDERFTAAKDRSNAVILDWEYVKADAQECHFRGVVDALAHRRSITGQSRDRVYREVSRRTQDKTAFSATPGRSMLKEGL